MSLTGAVAFVTGASGGLGAQICADLAAEGVDVAVGFRGDAAAAEAVCQRVRQLGRTAEPVPLDQTDPASVESAVRTIVERFGGLDLLVNNAGMASGGHRLPAGDLDALTPEIWDEMMAVNVRGPYLVVRAAAALLRASRWGRVVNVASTIGHGPFRAEAAYTPSKGAIVPLTRFLAAALAPGVTVNCVSPGLMTGTKMSGGAPESFIRQWEDQALLKTTTAIEDVSRQVLAFCNSATITGQAVVIDAGINFS